MARAGLYGAILSVGLAGTALGAPVTIVVTNVESAKGDIMVAVCTEREFLGPHCTYNGKAPAKVGPVSITLEVPSGVYAVQAYQDEDRNGEVTLNLLGIPKEPLGFSNNPTIGLSAPRFRESAFTLGAMGARVEIRLKRIL